MSFDINDYLDIKERIPEEKELLNLCSLTKDLSIQLIHLKGKESTGFYEELTTKIRSLIYEYVLKQENTKCSLLQKYLYLLFELYRNLSNASFMNKRFFLNFLYKRIFSFYNSLNSQDYAKTMIINEHITNLSKGQLKPIIHHCLNLMVNKFIFEEKNKLGELDYIFNYIKENEKFLNLTKFNKKISEIFFVQLICLDDFANSKTKNILKDENKVKEFIEDKIVEFYKLSMERDNNNEMINNNLYDEDNSNIGNEILFLFKNNFNKETTHLLKCLLKAILNVFTPTDSNILDFFEITIDKYIDKTNIFVNNKNENNLGIKLDILGQLFLDNHIQDVDIKIRNISFLIDIILQRYFNIQNIPELDLLKFPRINIIMNRLFIGQKKYMDCSKKELINAIFEHFVISQFIYNYLKYQIKDPEHYPIEIRYFLIYSYIKISEPYLITNPFSSYITSITFGEIINFLRLEKGFQKQKYMKNIANLKQSNEANLNNTNFNLQSNKNSHMKSKRRKSSSRTKKNKKKYKKKSIQKVEKPEEKININIDTSVLENFSRLEGDSISKNKRNILNKEEALDQPLKLLSKALFNYLCFIYSMQNQYKVFSEYFEKLYTFIDNYIEENIDSISLEEDWTWLFIHFIKFIKGFDLRKTFEKFNINIEKNNILETNIKLIAHLSKKVKYCNTQEHFLILDVIYNILININDLPNVLKAPKFSDKFKKLNRALSYLSFNINYSMDLKDNMSLIDQKIVGDRLFKITNLLFIDSIDEYFWIPKTLKGYKNFNDFITILESVFDKSLYKRSLYTEYFIYGLVAIKKYMKKFSVVKNQSKKEKEKEQYILSLDYFCKFEIPSHNTIKDLKEKSKINETIIELMELMPDIFDFKYDLNERVDLLKNILLNGKYDLLVCLFLICQLIINKKLEENSVETKLINKIFTLMINTEYKFMINFLLTLYKSIEKHLGDLIDEYVQLNFPENYNFSKKEYNKFLDLFNPEKPVESNNDIGKQIQIIYNNWTLIKKELEKSGAFYTFLEKAEEVNYPKSVMNLIEKYMFDITREKNIHNFSQINDQVFGKESLRIVFKKYLKLYYKAYSHIDDNKIILDNYFNNSPISSFIGNKSKSNSKTKSNLILSDNSPISIYELMGNLNKFLITLDINILSYSFSLINYKVKYDNYMVLKVINFLYQIYSLNEKNVEMEQRKNIFSLLKKMEKDSIILILGYNNKINEIYNPMNYSLWLYELSLYLEQLEIYISQNSSNDDFFNNMNNLKRKLRNLYINKRRIPHIKRNLLIFEFRRFIFNLHDDKISELYCLMDICKVYKSIYETGISNEEINDFREILKLYIQELTKIDNDILINIDKKLFLIPLKYYVKFLPDDNTIKFDEAYERYQNLYIKNKSKDFLSYKIIILKDKLKAKMGVVGINDILLDKIKKLGNKTSQNIKEGLLLYTDFYLDQLLTNESDFSCIKPRAKIKKIQIYDFNENIFKYLEGAIKICIITDKEKYLRKYMPEIINLFFKINLAHINYLKENNIDRNFSQTQSQFLIDENINKYIYLLEKFKKEVNINKIKIIIPQLIICYQYENTHLYNFAVELLVSYAQENIDLISFLLASFLNYKIEDMKTIGIKPYRNDSHSVDKYKNYISSFEKSKNFVYKIKHKLSERNQKILMGYEEFCSNLSALFFESKKMSNMSKKEMKPKQAILINNINMTLNNNNIILPTLDNLNRYKSSVRNNPYNDNNNSANNILFLKELDSKIDILASKEKPLHIRFKTRNINDDISPNKFYDFLLKCDVNDITKEIKTFEIIDEINNIFKMKHYDSNEQMSLKRYLIVPIAPTIILAEWLNNCISFSSVIEEQSKKDLIYQDEYKSIINNDTNKPYIIPGSIKNEEEKFNILYNYYQYNFFDPNLWYSAKKKYIISSAIWSMTQFLVGLGDRHPGNIMFNKNDGEVVHIDFGYVALKGLSLGVPEIVEFRLTFNLKKNLGLFEENGLFNYICVKVLKTFKEYYKTLSARIEYYQFDPLFDSENDNKTFKLFEQNDMFFNYLDDKNAKYKLKELIIKNTNPENLEKMYIWWSPWV